MGTSYKKLLIFLKFLSIKESKSCFAWKIQKNGVAMTFVFCVSNHFINRLELRLASVVDGSEVEP